MQYAKFAVFFLALLLLGGCGRDVERIAERQINGMLPEYVGPADKYSSRVRGSIGALAGGRMDSVTLDGWGVQLSENLTLDRLSLDLRKVHVDTKARQLRSVESITFTASLGEANLNRYVGLTRPEIAGLRVSLLAGRTVVQARPEVLGIGGPPLSIEGTVRTRADGYLLDFIPDAGKVSVLPVPQAALRFMLDRVNPVVDLSTLRIPVRVQRVEYQSGALILHGIVEPEDLMAVAAAAQALPNVPAR